MILRDISFIVIARNESFAIEKCLGSIASMPLRECEVICVDSGSTDDTLDVMKGYIGKVQNYSIIRCSGHVNAAVARNIGLRYAAKEYIFFVDGDVELCPDFISESLDKMKSGDAAAVTGRVEEIVYSDDYKQIKKPLSYHRYYPRLTEINWCGGNFIVKSQVREMVGPWDERMVRNQDIDFTLRLHRYGRLLALPVTMCTHHTLTYNERPWLHLKKRIPLCFGMLIRKNLDRPKVALSLLWRNRGFLAGFVVYGLFIVGFLLTGFLSTSFLYTVVAVSFIMIFDLFWGAIRKKNVLNHFVTHYLYVPLIVAGILFDVKHDRPATTVEQIC
ncbi:MAG: glycosyltransferase [Planctomycetes bacterium]|nr:glycosyltransferase [Planctomycetota bacterium]